MPHPEPNSEPSVFLSHYIEGICVLVQFLQETVSPLQDAQVWGILDPQNQKDAIKRWGVRKGLLDTCFVDGCLDRWTKA
jgi:hypothetical protein